MTYTEKDIDKFMEDNKDLMQLLAKQEEVDKLKGMLVNLKQLHETIGQQIRELENEIENQKS